MTRGAVGAHSGSSEREGAAWTSQPNPRTLTRTSSWSRGPELSSDRVSPIATTHPFADDFVFHFFNPQLPDLAGDYHGFDGVADLFERLNQLSETGFHKVPHSLIPTETNCWSHSQPTRSASTV